MTDSLLNVRNLRVSFPGAQGRTEVVRGIDFEMKAGEVLGLVGESGSGKSMTALSILGLVREPGRVSAEEMIWRGGDEPIDLLKISEKQRRLIAGNDIAMIFQEPMTSLNPVFTIGNQVGEGLKVHTRFSKKEIKQRVLEVLEQVRIPDPERAMRSYPHELSGGMRQRAMIAMALVCAPKLLLIDEPTTALDVTIQAQILELLRTLQREQNLAMLFITHDLGVIAEIADRLIVMKSGEIVERGDIVTMYQTPKHPYTKRLLEAVPQWKTEVPA